MPRNTAASRIVMPSLRCYCAGNIVLFERLFAAVSLEFAGCRFLPIVPRGPVEHAFIQKKRRRHVLRPDLCSLLSLCF